MRRTKIICTIGPSVDDKEIFFKVEIEAQFPGGAQNWTQYIRGAFSSQIENSMKLILGLVACNLLWIKMVM